MNTPLVLVYAFAALGIAAAVIALLAWRGWHKQREGLDGPPSVAPSDWHDVTQRYRESRIEALRDWMGEDHELVKQLPPRETPASRPAELPHPAESPRPPAAQRDAGTSRSEWHAAGTSPLWQPGGKTAQAKVQRPMQAQLHRFH
jgi:hypothetical protein